VGIPDNHFKVNYENNYGTLQPIDTINTFGLKMQDEMSVNNGGGDMDCCNRLFLEEFEDLNTSCKDNQKLSYTQ
jgi:hypothetical protein